MKIKPLAQDFSIYTKFNFERPPVAMKFLLHEPESIDQLDKTLAFCEMFKEAQERDMPFYVTKKNEDCAGKLPLGWEDIPPFAEYGQIGEKFGVFQEGRANGRMYQHIARFNKGVINYIAYSRLDKVAFEPDLLIITAPPDQAEIVLRAVSYSTGEILETKSTPVLNCSWLFVYPFLSGKVNFTITGLAFGSKSRQVFPAGLLLIAIPYQRIPETTRNLKEMEWVLPAYTDGREKFMKRDRNIFAEMIEEMKEDPQCKWK